MNSFYGVLFEFLFVHILCSSREADIYLLDDPLSAVDTAVGRFLFERCIRSHLKQQVVLLVTHQLQVILKFLLGIAAVSFIIIYIMFHDFTVFQYLSAADVILLMHDGRIVASGDMATLQKSHPAEFAQVLAETEQSYRQLEMVIVDTS